MITASSPSAASFLTNVFGTPTTSVPGLPDADAPAPTDTSSPAYLLDGSLNSSSDIDLTNILFAQDTQSLLANPYANGTLTGTPSTNVQKLLSELDPQKTSATPTPTPTTTTPSTSTLPPEGLLA